MLLPAAAPGPAPLPWAVAARARPAVLRAEAGEGANAPLQAPEVMGDEMGARTGPAVFTHDGASGSVP